MSSTHLANQWEPIYQKCLDSGNHKKFNPTQITSLPKSYHKIVYALILYSALRQNIDINSIPFGGTSGRSGIGILFHLEHIPDEIKQILDGYLNTN